MIAAMKSPILSFAIILTLCLGALNAVYADSATWSLNPTNGDWNTAANWTPPTIPNGSADTATFDVSNQTSISLSDDTEVNGIAFNPGASAFSVTASTRAELTFSGAGITNNSGVTQNFVTTVFEGHSSPGAITFSGTSTAGSDTIFTNHAGPSAVFDVGATIFRDQSSAGDATLINLGGTADGRSGGETNFYGGSGGHSTIIVNGAEVTGASGGRVYVGAGSSLESATLIISGDHGLEGGFVILDEGSSGGTAAVEVFGSGSFDTSLNPFFFGPEMRVGSIEGNGTIVLGDSTLNVGSNNRRTTFQGLITDGDSTEGFGGSLVKSGLEGLTLADANSYTRSTVVMSGVLRVANERGSATGKGPVHVAGGTLGGPGRIGGPVRIGSDNGNGAFLAPSIHANEPTTLTVHRKLSFKVDGTYTYKLNTRNATADQVIATGVTIESGAQFNFVAVGSNTLTPGTVFTAIDNTSANPITGTFSNLPEGSIVTINGNNFQASYSGGDGNDLTLTVVP